MCPSAARSQWSQDLRLGSSTGRERCWARKKPDFSVGPVILQLCHPRRKTNSASVFFRLMALEKMSNRSQKVVLGASNDSFEVGSCKKIETDFLPKYDSPHKMLTKNRFYFLAQDRFLPVEQPSLRSWLRVRPLRAQKLPWL